MNKKQADKIMEEIHDLVDRYRAEFPEFVELRITAVCGPDEEHNWISHKLDNFDVTGKAGPVREVQNG